MPTPFELFLHSELDIERQRFGSKWLFNWHRINIENSATDVDNFRGGRIRLGGVKFGGQPQQIFWETFDRYLRIQIHGTFKKWDEETQAYTLDKRRSSLDAASGLLESFVGQLVEHATDTDRRLRGRGFPKDVPIYNSSGSTSAARAEIFRLKASFHAQLDDELSAPITAKTSDMVNEFKTQIAGEATSAKHRLSEHLKQIEAKHAAEGKLISGASIRSYVAAIIKELSNQLSFMEAELEEFTRHTDLDGAAAVELFMPELERMERSLGNDPTFSKLGKAVGGETAQNHFAAKLKRVRPEFERRIKRIKLGISSGPSQSEKQSTNMNETDIAYDVFVSHASEDKDSIVRPFVTALMNQGLRVWYDESSLGWGASLRQEIDKGLARSRFGVVVLSKHFFSKSWPQAELDGLFAKEMNGGERVLPIWHEITKEEVAAKSPILASKMARNSSDRSVEDMASELASLCRGVSDVSRTKTPQSYHGALIDRLKQWHTSGRAEFESEIAQNVAPSMLPLNNIQFSYSILTSTNEQLELRSLGDVLLGANKAIRDRVNTGWSMFYPFTDAPIRPFYMTDPDYKDGETEFLECSLFRKTDRSEAAHDLWRVSPSGDATLLRPMRSDFMTELPAEFASQGWFSPHNLMREVAEFVRHAEAYCSAFESPSKVAFRCEWRGLKGRDFVHPYRDWHSGNIAQSNTRITKGVWTVDQVAEDWPAIVAALIGPVVRCFRSDLELSAERILLDSENWRPIGNTFP